MRHRRDTSTRRVRRFVYLKRGISLDQTIMNLEEDVNRLRKRLDEEIKRADELADATAELNGRIEDHLTKETEIRTQTAELHNLNSVLNDEVKGLQEQLSDLRTELTEANDKNEQHVQTGNEHQEQLIQKQREAQEMEEALKSFKTNLQDLEIKLETVGLIGWDCQGRDNFRRWRRAVSLEMNWPVTGISWRRKCWK